MRLSEKLRYWLLKLICHFTLRMGEERGNTGGRKTREKEGRLQEDIARQAETTENEANRIRAQLIPGSQEASQFESIVSEVLNAPARTTGGKFDLSRITSSGNQLLSQQQQRIASGEPATPLEARTQGAFSKLRDVAGFVPEEQDIFNVLRGDPTATPTGEIFGEALEYSPEEQAILNAFRGTSGGSPADSILSDIVARGDRPDEFFKSTLDPQLTQVNDFINRQFSDRGLLGSGLQIEQLGRSGVDLAIQEAKAREDFRQQQRSNVDVLLQRALGLPGERQSRTAGVFDIGQRLRGREIGVEEAGLNLQQGRESNLTGLLASQTGNATENMLELLGARTTRAEGLRDVASSLREAERQATEQFIGNLISPEASFNLGPVSIKKPGAGDTLRNAFQGTSTSPTIRGPQPGGDVSSLVAGQRQPQSGASPNLSSGLSRRKQGSDFVKLLMAAFGSGGA